ncbi:hypothetical protein [Nocardiopsis sp. JB363]|uniref:hypothetical protein n=1 Tax=Nocardiopsis sp. JB363 TaxID=1434837 RepID=UPI00190E97E8|nr:hypothetical protein [Nocardiopsis sp. JB363]
MNTLLASTMVLADSFSLDKDTVTPGVMGFLAIFAIGVVLYFLMRNMTGKLRGVSDRAEEAGEKAPSAVDDHSTEEDVETEKGDTAEAKDSDVRAAGSETVDSGTDKG